MIRSSPPSRSVDAQPDDRRAQDVAGVDERGVDARRDLDLLAVVGPAGTAAAAARRPSPCRAARRGRSSRCGGWRAELGLGIASARRALDRRRASVVARGSPSRGRLGARRASPPRQVDRRLVRVRSFRSSASTSSGMAALPAGLALGELLVEPARVEQDQASPARSCRPWHGSGRVKPSLDQERQEAAVVEVGMRQQDGVEVGRLERERDPVADRLVRAALEHAAVDQDARPLGDEQELRAGDGRRAAEETDLHRRHGDSRACRTRRQTGMTTRASRATAANSRLR